jgi:hypothetical protein
VQAGVTNPDANADFHIPDTDTDTHTHTHTDTHTDTDTHADTHTNVPVPDDIDTGGHRARGRLVFQCFRASQRGRFIFAELVALSEPVTV